MAARSRTQGYFKGAIVFASLGDRYDTPKSKAWVDWALK